MLEHIALTVNDSEEIKNFYEKVLRFKVKHKFVLKRQLSQMIFNVTAIPDVYLMRQQDLEFEIFISPEKENRVFSHICLSYQKPENIYKNALKSGYRILVKDGENHYTWFIWDKSGNIFEIKVIHT